MSRSRPHLRGFKPLLSRLALALAGCALAIGRAVAGNPALGTGTAATTSSADPGPASGLCLAPLRCPSAPPVPSSPCATSLTCSYHAGTNPTSTCFTTASCDDQTNTWSVFPPAPGCEALPDSRVVRAPCPSDVPVQGSSCVEGRSACEYGPNASGACSTVATCEASGWRIDPPFAGCGTAGASCPAAFASITPGASCDSAALACDYAEGRCACADRCGKGKSVWVCEPWRQGANACGDGVTLPKGAACPIPRPLLGSPCATEGTECDYSFVCSQVPPQAEDMMCVHGTWVLGAHGVWVFGGPRIPCATAPECLLDGGA